MKLYRLERTQELGTNLEETWKFFSNPYNLERITPHDMNFQILSSPPKTIHSGLIIEYRITLPPGIPISWVTEIKHVEAPYRFVDEQRFGPYRFWYHEHRFQPSQNGTIMVDMVSYQMPLGWLGRLIHFLSVHDQLHRIFNFRFDYLQHHFNSIITSNGEIHE
ncbi:MAG: SRPBCC family protein [SAR324 cluster bacterium]|nr:SRPBCC family protein [SAR324 cluster bacterium]